MVGFPTDFFRGNRNVTLNPRAVSRLRMTSNFPPSTANPLASMLVPMSMYCIPASFPTVNGKCGCPSGPS